jgi:protein-disulfide isomerase
MSLMPPVGDRDHVRGPASAPVTLVEYGDYQCPYCGAAYQVVKALQARLGRELRFVFRNFPLTQVHAHAEHAAEAAEAVSATGGSDAFWTMHDTLFEHQTALQDADLVRYAESVGVDGAVVTEALATHEYLPRVKSDFMSGVRSGVNGTPSFFINGTKYDGSNTLEGLGAALQAAIPASHRR